MNVAVLHHGVQHQHQFAGGNQQSWSWSSMGMHVDVAAVADVATLQMIAANEWRLPLSLTMQHCKIEIDANEWVLPLNSQLTLQRCMWSIPTSTISNNRRHRPPDYWRMKGRVNGNVTSIRQNNSRNNHRPPPNFCACCSPRTAAPMDTTPPTDASTGEVRLGLARQQQNCPH
jgi:hypothetical protein